MEQKSIIAQKSFDFALKIISLYQFLSEQKKEFIMSKQLLRSGTSISANMRKSQNAESPMDFVHKIGIAQKETDETLYWLELLLKSGFFLKEQYEEYIFQWTEILKIIRSIIITKKEKSNLSFIIYYL